jgi:hypothetical protein
MTPHETRAVLALVEELDRLRARALALISGEIVEGGISAVQPEWTTLARAAAKSNVSERTMATHARRFGLGHRPAGTWLIDMVRVRAWQAGEPFEPLRGE